MDNKTVSARENLLPLVVKEKQKSPAFTVIWRESHVGRSRSETVTKPHPLKAQRTLTDESHRVTEPAREGARGQAPAVASAF